MQSAVCSIISTHIPKDSLYFAYAPQAGNRDDEKIKHRFCYRKDVVGRTAADSIINGARPGTDGAKEAAG